MFPCDTKKKGLYADAGLCGTNGQPNLVGTYAWVEVDESYNYVQHGSGLVGDEPDKRVENNMAELAALVHGLRALPDGWCGNIYSDNANALGWSKLILNYDGQPRESGGCPKTLLRYAEHQMKRLGRVYGVRLDGHPKPHELASGIGHSGFPVSKWNQFCDDYCNAERAKFTIVNGIKTSWRLTGHQWARLRPEMQAELLALGFIPPGRKLAESNRKKAAIIAEAELEERIQMAEEALLARTSVTPPHTRSGVSVKAQDVGLYRVAQKNQKEALLQ